jgi:hypothetical protein
LVSINAHSGIGPTHNGFIFRESIPNSILTIVTATTPGVCNYTIKGTAQQKNSIILSEFEDFISSNPSSKYEDKPRVNSFGERSAEAKNIKTYISHVITKLKNVDKDKKQGIYSLKTKNKDKSPDTSEYLHMFSKGHNVQYKKNNSLVMNKLYQISEQDNIDRKNMVNFEDSIKLLNVDENDLMDILPNMASPGNGFATDTETLTDFLSSRGAKNIIIFDFSCSDFEAELRDRTKRATRRLFEKTFDMKNASPPIKTGVKRRRIDANFLDSIPKIKKQKQTKKTEELFYKNYYKPKRKNMVTRRNKNKTHRTGSSNITGRMSK